MQVAATDHRDVVWHRKTLLQNGIHCAHRCRVAVTENPVWPRLASKQFQHCLCTLSVTFCLQLKCASCSNVFWRKLQTARCNHSLESSQSAIPNAVSRTANMRNPTAAPVNEMLCGHGAYGFII